MTHIDDDLGKVAGVVDSLVAGPDHELSLLEVYEERINALKTELFNAFQTILALDHADQRLTDSEISFREDIFYVHEHIWDLFISVQEEVPMHIDPRREVSKFLLG